MRTMVCAIAALGLSCGVETYRERAPAPTLAVRLVGSEGELEAVRCEGIDCPDGILMLQRSVIVSAEHVRHVRLLDAADGRRLIVLDLDDVARARLREVTRAREVRLAVVIEGVIVSAPFVRGELDTNEAHISLPEPVLERAFDRLTLSTDRR